MARTAKVRATRRVVQDAQFAELLNYFRALEDPRSTVNRHHTLSVVTAIMLCAVLAGADGPTAIAYWAEASEAWLRQFVPLPHGVPSHDTFGRVLQALKPAAFQACFVDWIDSLRARASTADDASRTHLAIGGKTLRRSHDHAKQLGPLHVVSVLATEVGVLLGQLATEEKSNEITAIPALLEQLHIDDAIIMIDAMGCQKAIAQTILDGGADYVLNLKGNHETLYRAVHDYVDKHLANDFARITARKYEERDKKPRHGRQEHRIYYQFAAPKTLPGRADWPGLRTIGVAIRITRCQGRETSEVRYYLSSLPLGVQQLARVIRQHWRIEAMHWSLDVTFREDDSRLRARHAADNLAWLRRFAHSLYRQHPGSQSLAMKRRLCGWNPDFLLQVLTGQGS